MDTDDLCNETADFSRRIELSLALATLRSKVPHQVFIGIAKDVIAFSPVLGKVQSRILEYGDEVGQSLDHLLTAPELIGIVEVREIRKVVGLHQRSNDLGIDLITDVSRTFECHHVLEARTVRDLDRSVRNTSILVADVFDEQKDQHIVLVLAGIHTATKLVAGLPKRGIEFGFFESHRVTTS